MKFERAPYHLPWAKYINPLLDWAERQNFTVGPGMLMHQGGNGIAIGLIPRVSETAYFFARITASGKEQPAQQARYLYSWIEVEKTSSGYTASNPDTTWTALSGGRSGSASGQNPARNWVEAGNLDAPGNHALGNGVTVDERSYVVGTGMDMSPCPHIVVAMYEVVLTNGSKEYWFAYENSMDGDCDPPA